MTLEFTLPQAQIEEGRKKADPVYLRETLFVVPRNDGEAERVVQILQALHARVRISEQRWGATLDRENIGKKDLEGVKRVVIMEIPSVRAEDELRSKGYEVVIVDHHNYNELDRQNPVSSLEQIATLLNWPLSETDMAIAVNDRSYIPGLKAMGFDDNDIRSIRQFDLLAQGNTLDHIQKATRNAFEVMPKLKVEAGVSIIDFQVEDEGILKQELALREPNGIAHTLTLSMQRISFSGDPSVTNTLFSTDFVQLGYTPGTFAKYMGGDPKGSTYFGFAPREAPRGSRELVPFGIQKRIREIVRQARFEAGHQ